MALTPTRLEYRLALSNVDRGHELTETVIVARHPSETQEHATLRMLAYCLLHEERLEFGPGLSSPDIADLWTHDLTGRVVVTWVECGNAETLKLRKAQQHNPGLALHVVLADERRAEELRVELAATKLPRGSHDPLLWVIDAALVDQLAAREERRQKWAVTLVGDHFYIDVDGKNYDGAITQITASGLAS